jgi:hypothetical protein
MVNTKSSVFTPLPYNFVDEIKFVLSDCRLLVLLHDQLRSCLVFIVIVLQDSLDARWLLNESLFYDFFGLHVPENVFVEDLMSFVELSDLMD